MTEYFANLIRRLNGQNAPAVQELAEALSHSDRAEGCCAFAGIPAQRLEEAAGGAPLTPQETLALLAVGGRLALAAEEETLRRLGRLAGEHLEEWCAAAEQAVRSAGDAVDCLLRRTGMEEEAFLSSYHFFLDASSLSDPAMPPFLDKLIPRLKRMEKPYHITVPQAVINCINSFLDDPRKAELTGSRLAMEQLSRLQAAKLLSVRGDEGDTTVLSTFLSALSRFKPKYHLVLITQDEALARAVQMLNLSGVEGPEILLGRLQPYGTVTEWFAEPQGEVQLQFASEETLVGPAPEPEGEPALKPLTDSVPDPAMQPAADTDPEPDPEPVCEPEPDPAPDPTPEGQELPEENPWAGDLIDTDYETLMDEAGVGETEPGGTLFEEDHSGDVRNYDISHFVPSGGMGINSSLRELMEIPVSALKGPEDPDPAPDGEATDPDDPEDPDTAARTGSGEPVPDDSADTAGDSAWGKLE